MLEVRKVRNLVRISFCFSINNDKLINKGKKEINRGKKEIKKETYISYIFQTSQQCTPINNK